MRNMKFWRTALVAALVLTVMLSVTGGTIAWFTDEVVSGENLIKAGNLDIEVNYKNHADSTWSDLEKADNLFKNVLWEPGHTEVVYLQVKNAGTLALNFKANFEPVNEIQGVNVAGETFKLSDYLAFGMTEEASAVQNFANGKEARNAIKFKAAGMGIDQETYTEEAKLEAGEEAFFALVIYMPETVGNEANYRDQTGLADPPSVSLKVNVLARQAMSESDSFDSTYDENATYKVATGEQLLNTLNEINALPENAIATLELVGDASFEGETLNIKAGNEITIDLAGHDLNITNNSAVAGTNVAPMDAIVVGDGATLNLINTGDNAALEIKAADGKNAITVADGGVLNVETTVNLPGDDNTIFAASADAAKPAIVNIKDGAALSTAAEENAVVTLGANAVGNMDGGIINTEYSEHSQSGCAWGVVLDDSSAEFNMTGGIINVDGKHCASGIYSYGNASTINVTGGTINVAGNVTDAGSGYNIGIEAASDCKLNMSGVTINVTSKGGTQGAAVMVGNRVDVTMNDSVKINVTNYPDEWEANYSICDYNDGKDITQNNVDRTGTFTVDGIQLTAENREALFQSIVTWTEAE